MKSSSANLLSNPLHLALSLPSFPPPSVSVAGERCFPSLIPQHSRSLRSFCHRRGIWPTTRPGDPKALPETRPTRPSLLLHVAQGFFLENHRSHPENAHILPRITCSIPTPRRNDLHTPIFADDPLVPRPNPIAQNTFVTDLTRHAVSAYFWSRNHPSLLETGIIYLIGALAAAAGSPVNCITSNIAATAPFSHRRLPR